MTVEQLEAIGLGQYRGDPIPVPADAPHENPRDEGAAIDPVEGGFAGMIFVNFDGATLGSGYDDSHSNTTQIGNLAGPFAAYGNDPNKRAAVMEAVRQDWGEYNVGVVDTRPASGDYTMNMTGPTNPFGGGVLGIAPLDCWDQQTHNNVTFAFHSANDGFSAAITATTIGQEVAHSYGLEHVDEPGDIMNPYNAGGDPSFRDQCIQIVQNLSCPQQHAQYCGSQTMQNSHQELLGLFGPAVPDMAPPTVSITFPMDGAVYPPGSNFEVMVEALDDTGIESVQLFNNGDPLQSDASEPFGWGVNNIPEGAYELQVIATDIAGNQTMSNLVNVYVGEDPPPMGDGSGGGDGADDGDGDGDGGTDDGGDDTGEPVDPIACAEDDGSLTLPDGFCATIFAEGVGPARHVTVTPSGDVFVALSEPLDGVPGGIVALRDEDGDGQADREERFGDLGGNGITWWDNKLYQARDAEVLRYALADGELTPTGSSERVVGSLPDDGDHPAKSLVIDAEGNLFVSIASASNACQVENRVAGSPGIDPCPELDVRAGVWRFDAESIEQTLADGERYSSGIRNATALAINPLSGALWTAQNGRDQLYDLWPDVYQPEDEENLPSEEILRLTQGGDYGWPYCYHDPQLGQKVLAPEYGGDGTMVERCADVSAPDAILTPHAAPLGLLVYTGEMFPAKYRGGLFVASHGSRFSPEAAEPPGYDVQFVPLAEGEPQTEPQKFAGGFAGDERPLPDAADFRPVGLAQAPDGSIYVTDDQTGRIWRLYYGVK
jgi:glucose/arabinose dehydrogenase